MMRTKLAGLKAIRTRQARRRAATRPSLEPLEQRRLLASFQLVGTSDLVLTVAAGGTSNQVTIPLGPGQSSVQASDPKIGGANLYFDYEPTPADNPTLLATLLPGIVAPGGTASGSIESGPISLEVIPDASDTDPHMQLPIDVKVYWASAT
jgi:hypothetical protein